MGAGSQIVASTKNFRPCGSNAHTFPTGAQGAFVMSAAISGPSVFGYSLGEASWIEISVSSSSAPGGIRIFVPSGPSNTAPLGPTMVEKLFVVLAV